MPTATETEVGTVVSLWRYPVKSMMGEELGTEITKRGLRGDRAYALIDNLMVRRPLRKTRENGRGFSISGRDP